MGLTRACLDSAARHGARAAVIDGGKSWSYAELAAAVERVAGHVAEATDREAVGIYLPNSAGFVAAFLGALAAGKAAVPLNLFLAPPELAAILDHAGVDTVITAESWKEKVSDTLAVKVSDTFSCPGGAKLLFIEKLLAAGPPGKPAGRKEADLAVILYTSGSTGEPKGVCLTHGNLLANARGAAEAAGFCAEDHVLGALPPFHTFALTTAIIAPLLTGASVVTMARFSPEAALDLAAEGVSVILGVPSMYRLMARAQRARPRKLPRLRLAIAGGERLPPKVREEFEPVFGLPLCEGYGLTECSPVVALNVPGTNRPGTVGRPLSHLEVRIAGADGQALPAGAEGEVRVRGASVMRGYHRAPEATRGVLAADGWLSTGDLGRLSADGYLSLTGRLKELIIVGGENVHPAEVEAALARHPAVAECAVLGASDGRRGEQVVAFVLARPGAGITPEALRAHCRGELAGYKVPRKVFLTGELPKGPTGKVDKQKLARRVAESRCPA
jgi:long-chain acyl-CoA synthetase